MTEEIKFIDWRAKNVEIPVQLEFGEILHKKITILNHEVQNQHGDRMSDQRNACLSSDQKWRKKSNRPDEDLFRIMVFLF